MGKKTSGAAPSSPEEPLMTLPELATYLHLDEKTVFKLVQAGKIPALTIEGKYRFRHRDVDEWLELQLVDDADFAEMPDGMQLPLEDLLPDQSIIADLKASTPIGVIEELAARAAAGGWLVDKAWFVGAIVEREAIASTAMEGGVAFLHTRARDKGKIARPFLIIGRSWKGIPFGSADGGPTYLFFLMGLKYDRLHLPVLGRLARALRNPTTIAKLRSLSSTTQIRALLLKEDEQARAGIVHSYDADAFKPKLDRQLRLRTLKRLTAMRNKPEPAPKGKGKAKAKPAEAKAVTPVAAARPADEARKAPVKPAVRPAAQAAAQAAAKSAKPKKG